MQRLFIQYLVGKHSTVVPETPKPAAKVEPSAKPVIDANGVEVYGTPKQTIAAETFVPKPVDAKPAPKEEELHDPADAHIAEGTKCKRNACGKTWDGEHSRTEECVFHPGQAIFHEGSKVGFGAFHS